MKRGGIGRQQIPNKHDRNKLHIPGRVGGVCMEGCSDRASRMCGVESRTLGVLPVGMGSSGS